LCNTDAAMHIIPCVCLAFAEMYTKNIHHIYMIA
jgi:hypothetical protein